MPTITKSMTTPYTAKKNYRDIGQTKYLHHYSHMKYADMITDATDATTYLVKM